MSTTRGDCDPLVADASTYPRRPVNRAALSRIGYRVGEYPDMVEAMVRQVDREVSLAAWTHRGADDPAIALLEGAAILGDILTFYQERYANEAFLRTATWRESITELVRLTGYRPAPALGGLGTLAVEVRGTRPVVVPARWPVKADLDGAARPTELETAAELLAWPHLSRFHLYRARHRAGWVIAGARTVELTAVGGSAAAGAVAALGLRAGDRLMLLADPPVWESAGTAFTAVQQTSQVLEVAGVRRVLDRTLVDVTTDLQRSWTAPITAYRLGRTFRHVGHAAGPTFTRNILDGTTITGARQHTTAFLRHVYPHHDCATTSADRNLPAAEIPLDQEVRDLLVGAPVVVEARIKLGSVVRDLAVRRTITHLRHTSMGFAAWTGPVTTVRMGAALVRHTGLAVEADIRDYRVHEVTSAALTLRPQATGDTGAFSSGTDALWFYGTAAEAAELAGRRVTLVRTTDAAAQTLTVVNDRGDFAGGTALRTWPVSFDAPPHFPREAFDEEAPTVSVLGNLVDVTEGKAVPTGVLGNGDARAVFQTFKLPRPPTHHLAPGATPPQVPELAVQVADRIWTRVPSLFGQPGDAEVYVVREDADGNGWVQFGDGLTGARLPSGIGNVAATLRTGAGSRGPLKPGTTPSSAQRIAEVTTLAMPEGVHGGTDREPGDHARQVAPGKVQGLDRLVSLADYETELLTVPGVVRVRARWDVVDAVPTVLLLVLLEQGREAEFEAVRATIASYQRCRGPDRFPLVVEQAFLREVFLDLRYGLDARHLREDVEAGIVAALAPRDTPAPTAVPGDLAVPVASGLFAARSRSLGAAEYASRIEGSAQQVTGVTFAHVTALGMFSPTASRSGGALPLPAAPRPLLAQVLPAANEILSLTLGALTLQDAPPDVQGACS
ncbi:baseplate J/gp47 family protein [Kineococcus indalonis]|uniref:hypothetical protein n=1 Tax=Kineococcus indalonis TaxID=2696566 RepID=UPI0014128620|nr:hypothetical protein [Kineococcus indalonis]NAZ84903.1 hypothetical protein [Kineococcus indalonis]